MTHKCKALNTLTGLATTAFLLATGDALAVPYSVLLESDADRTSNEIYLANYDSFSNLISNTLSASSAYSALNVSSNFSVGGYTQVGSGYSVLLESNADRTNNEIYLANYDLFGDLLSNTLSASSAYSALNVSSNFSVGGFTHDPSGYSVLLESDADRSTNEIYIAHYVDFNALLTNTLSVLSGYSALNVSSNFSVGGFTYDGSGGYSVLLESNQDRANNEIYLANYLSFEDLINNNLASTSTYSTLNVSSNFSVGGLAVDWYKPGGPTDTTDPGDGGFPDDNTGDGGGRGGDPDDNPGDGGGRGGIPIPEPTMLSLFSLALAGFGLAARRRRILQDRH